MRIRTNLIAILAAWCLTILFAAHMLMSVEVARWESRFDGVARHLADDVKNKLDTNEAVLAGFSAFLQAVESGDTESASKYAASAAASYSHIYMLEVARRVLRTDEAEFQSSLRKGWRADFSLKDFSELTKRPKIESDQSVDTWPILFMYPPLPEAQDIYGLRLETVDYLSQEVKLAKRRSKPLVSPIFALYEGGNAYILLEKVSRAASPSSPKPNFFGNTMIALLIIKAQALLPKPPDQADLPRMQMSAYITSPEGIESLLFERLVPESAGLDTLFLPYFKRQLKINNSSQPVVMDFAYQLRWGDLLNQKILFIFGLIFCATLFVPWLTIRHYAELDRSALALERSAYLSTHDVLTGLANRFLFMDRFEHALQSQQRNGGLLALMILDLDHFKAVNDSFGHAVGDEVLVASARRLSHELRANDTVARYGGDEFVILLANVSNREDAKVVGEKILTAISAPIETSAGQISICCSIGISLCPEDGKTLDSLSKAADQAMYDAKQHGRNRVSLSSAGAA